MKKKILYITTTAVLTVSAFALGSATPVQGGKETMIPLSKCIPLEDIACAYTSSSGYMCFELGDYGNKLDNSHNRSYKAIKKEINSFYKSVKETKTGVLFAYEDGTGFYISKGGQAK